MSYKALNWVFDAGLWPWSEFKLQSNYYAHFWTNILEKGMNPLPMS